MKFRWSSLFVLGIPLLGRAPAGEPQTGFLSGDPADDLPAYVTRLTWFGERPDISHDGKKVAFVSKIFGDVMEYDFRTGRIECLSDHYPHYGYTRVNYLVNGDLLLAGPAENFDETDEEGRKQARGNCRLFVLQRPFDRPAVPLGVYAEEGPAVSRTDMKIAWTRNREQKLMAGRIEEIDGVPKLVDQRVIYRTTDFPHPVKGLETQNFVPPAETKITISAYCMGPEKTNTDTYTLDLETGELAAITDSPAHYDEPEGIFPDGLHTLVEHAPSRGKAWPLIDLFKVAMDGSGKLERLTFFSDYSGWKASQGVVSDDGSFMVFQIGKSGDEAGRGYGVFRYDFGAEGAAETVELWPDGPPNEAGSVGEEALWEGKSGTITNVSEPTLTVHRPAAPNGTAVIVAPGGGLRFLSIENEGRKVAEWLNARGVTAFVLKYRVPFRGHRTNRWEAALEDGQQAMRLVRARAAEWAVDPTRIGMIGFSAGGEVAALTANAAATGAVADAEQVRPDFVALIYPGGLFDNATGALREHLKPGEAWPPVFAVHAANDHVKPQNSLLLAAALAGAGGDVAVHLYPDGGHGYGLGRGDGSTVEAWPSRFEEWLAARGLIDTTHHNER